MELFSETPEAYTYPTDYQEDIKIISIDKKTNNEIQPIYFKMLILISMSLLLYLAKC